MRQFNRKPFIALAALVMALLVSLGFTALPAQAAETPVKPYTGIATNIGKDGFTLQMGDGSVRIAVTMFTTFTKNGKLVTFADLKAGMKVEVLARQDGNRTIGLRVNILPEPTPPPARIETYRGKVVAKGDNTFKLYLNGKTMEFKVTGDTKFYRSNGQTVKFGDLKLGMEVEVKAKLSGNATPEAQAVLLPAVQTQNRI